MKRLLLAAALCLAAAASARPLDETFRLRRVHRGNHRVVVQRIPAIEAKRNFCVPASVEMVVRYHGGRVNQRDLGKIFDSSRKFGTNIAGLSGKFGTGPLRGFICKDVYGMTIPELGRMLNVYLDSPELSAVSRKRFLKHIDPKKGDPDALDFVDQRIVYATVAESRPELLKKFPEILKEYIDQGYPLLWSVAMNLDPHDRNDGFHMRVICGYVTANDGKITDVIYLDPWTGRRKYKEVTLEQATAMTTSIKVVQRDE